MPSTTHGALLISLQSVFESIHRFEALLGYANLKDTENIEELIGSYDEALKVLKAVYAEQLELELAIY